MKARVSERFRFGWRKPDVGYRCRLEVIRVIGQGVG